MTARPRPTRAAGPVRAVLLVLAAGLALAACTGGDAGGASEGTTGSSEPVEGGAATIAIDSPFFGFDPNVTPAAQDARVLRQVFDSLLHLDDAGQVQPWLASAWEVSEDGLEYTFTTREDVTFSDGTAFDAEAVCFNLDRIAAPETGSIYAIGLIGPYASCEATDASTAVVTLEQPYAPFLNNLTSPFLGINSPTAAAAVEPADYLLAPTGSGPWVIESYTPNDRVVLTRNDDYAWAPENAGHTGAAYLETVTFQIIPDPTVRMGTVRTGSAQAASNVPPTEIEVIESDPSLALLSQEQSGAPFQLHLNTSRPPFDDPVVREAARAALDIDAALQALYLGSVDRAWGPLAPTTLGYDAAVEDSFAYDAEQAGALLDEAGWTTGADGVRTKDGETLSVVYMEGSPNRENRQDLATFFEANLEAVGFEVEVVLEQTAQLQTRQQEGEYDIAGLSLVAVDPNVLYQMYDSRFRPEPGQTGFNLSRTDEAGLDEQLTGAQSELDPDARVQTYADIQAQVVADVRSIGVYVPAYTLAVNGLEGLRFDAEGYPILYDAFLAP